MPESVSEPSTTSQPGTAHSITCDCPKQRAVLRMLAFVIGGLFLFSAYAKLAGINAFEVYLVKEGLMPNRSVAAVFSRLLIGFEGLIGLAFFFKNGLRKVTSIVALIMLGVFSIFLAIQAAKGNSDSCHCFGELLPMSAGQSLGKNIAMMAGIGWVMYRSRSWNVGSCPFGKPVILAIIAVGFLGGPFLLKPMASFNPAPNPPIQADPDVPEKPSRFAQFNQFEPEVSPITEGKVLVIFVSLDCEHCRELVTKLSFATDRNQHPPVRLIAFGDPELLADFRTETGSKDPIHLLGLDPEVFFDFVETNPPVTYLLEDGEIVQTWTGDAFSFDMLENSGDSR